MQMGQTIVKNRERAEVEITSACQAGIQNVHCGSIVLENSSLTSNALKCGLRLSLGRLL